jgi:hypothetical protein
MVHCLAIGVAKEAGTVADLGRQPVAGKSLTLGQHGKPMSERRAILRSAEAEEVWSAILIVVSVGQHGIESHTRREECRAAKFEGQPSGIHAWNELGRYLLALPFRDEPGDPPAPILLENLCGDI